MGTSDRKRGKGFPVSAHVTRALRARKAPPQTSVEAVERLLYETIMHPQGVQTGARKASRHVAGNCTAPVTVVVASRVPGTVKRWKRRNYMAQVELQVRCRKCDKCKAYRGRLWRHRAIAETQRAERTWFGTLTIRPDQQYRLEGAARLAYGQNWDGLSHDAQFAALAAQAGKLVTLWLKRVRANGGMSAAQRLAYRRQAEQAGSPKEIEPVAFRYLVTCEVHNGSDTSVEMRGRPHFHFLIHENAGAPLRKDGIAQPWEWGFTNIKLVKGIAGAMYVAKYLSKADDVRVRASENYGQT